MSTPAPFILREYDIAVMWTNQSSDNEKKRFKQDLADGWEIIASFPRLKDGTTMSVHFTLRLPNPEVSRAHI